MLSSVLALKVGRPICIILLLYQATRIIMQVTSGDVLAGGRAVDGIPRVPLIISTELKLILQIKFGCNQGFNVLGVPVLRVENVARHVRMFARKLMKPFKNKLILVLLVLLILIVVIPLILFLVLARQKEHKPGADTPNSIISHIPGGVTSWTVINRNVPTFASSGIASGANDESYDTTWSASAIPAWLAYNLSGAPAAERGRVLVAWHNSS
jgi:hypothetical protein